VGAQRGNAGAEPRAGVRAVRGEWYYTHARLPPAARQASAGGGQPKKEKNGVENGSGRQKRSGNGGCSGRQRSARTTEVAGAKRMKAW